ncbi:hypothetical protein J4226_05195 [Candidatus Pacearchaeota archaeon]|nr:hypothetical protein [Candidatus Pacearchaeota archaeon]
MGECKCCEDGCGKDIRVSFCPRCNSRNVGFVFGFGNLFGVIPKMKCRDCDFDAASFPILITSEEELKRAIEGMKMKREAKKKVVKKVVKKKVVKKKREVKRK